MLMMIPHDPVGLPGLIALAIGFVVFVTTLIAARRRGKAGTPDSGGRRDNSSLLWIVVQGIGIGIAGFGPIAVRGGAASGEQLILGGVVLSLMLFTAWLFDWSSKTMGRNWALVARTRGDASLVTSGPFAYVRNPIYVALGLFMVAIAIAYGHVASLAVAAPIFALGTWMRVTREEKLLRATFGAAYDAYAARVKRFVPGLF